MLPAPAPHVTIVADRGGLVHDYSARVSAYLKRRVTVRIAGECASACTLVTALPARRLCVAPTARLEFHQAYDRNPDDPQDTTNRNEPGTAVLMSAYPAPVRAWLGQHGGLGPDLMTLEGAELASMFRMCPREDRR